MKKDEKKKASIADKQCGFVKKRNPKCYICTEIINRKNIRTKAIYLCFTDYTKALEKVKHYEVVKTMENIYSLMATI